MLAKKWFLTVCVVAGFALGLVGCASPATPPVSPTPSPSPPVTTATTAPTATSSPPPTSPAPSPSDEVIALYAAGSQEQARLYALAADGATADLDEDVYPRATASGDGRWIGMPSGQLPADAVVVTDLEADTTYNIPLTPDFDPYGMAFDPPGARLAFLELGTPAADGTPWAIVMVDLQDGSTTRFQAMTGPDDALLPGSPIGWSDDELLLNTFVPGTEQGSAGVWAVTLPTGAESAPLESLERRQVLPGDDYLFIPRLSPDGTRLLYLGRDYDYAPDNYGPVGYDVAVNRLGLLELTSGSSTLLVEETEGDALGMDVAWSLDGASGLFAKGRYAGNVFASLTLKTVDRTGTIADVAPVPLPADGYLISLDWCPHDTVLIVVATSDGVHQLYALDLSTGQPSRVASDDDVAVLRCVRQGRAEGANADVIHVRAVQTDGPEPGEGPGTWTFYVTVEHPDTGWEDYADGWDVVTPDGEVLKPDPESAFTRTLLHPHVDEQPFTRNQSGIVIPEGVTQVRVRAHDMVAGYGGQEVVVDLTKSSGPKFEVER